MFSLYDAAGKEFAFMKGRFSNYKSRDHYGMFLKRSGRIEEAKKIFTELPGEASHLSPNEKRNNRVWLNHAREELKTIGMVKA